MASRKLPAEFRLGRRHETKANSRRLIVLSKKGDVSQRTSPALEGEQFHEIVRYLSPTPSGGGRCPLE